MNDRESELAMVQRHVREGTVAVERQRAVLAKLQEAGSTTEMALEPLAQFEIIQVQQEAHLQPDAEKISCIVSACRGIVLPIRHHGAGATSISG
jgi:hypothetical protein